MGFCEATRRHLQRRARWRWRRGGGGSGSVVAAHLPRHGCQRHRHLVPTGHNERCADKEIHCASVPISGVARPWQETRYPQGVAGINAAAIGQGLKIIGK